MHVDLFSKMESPYAEYHVILISFKFFDQSVCTVSALIILIVLKFALTAFYIYFSIFHFLIKHILIYGASAFQQPDANISCLYSSVPPPLSLYFRIHMPAVRVSVLSFVPRICSNSHLLHLSSAL